MTTTAMTLVYPLDRQRQEILFGLKKVRIGAGTYVGFGGRVNEGETVAQAAVRELQEECGLTVAIDQLQQVGYLTIHNPRYPELGNLLIHVFTVPVLEQQQGEPRESDEMTPYWLPLDELPWGKMRESERYWLPAVLRGWYVTGEIWYDERERLVSMTTSIKALR